uniref:CX domain-containing protein n=1 Tax=Schistocephalus solidus TaxID=70667 RepID=A0A0X3PA43_SCHSO
MRVIVFVLLLATFLVLFSDCKPSRSKVGFSSYGKRSRHSFIGSRSSGLSMSRKSALLGTAAGLAGAYIGFKLASHDHLSRYTVCEGPRQELNQYGMMTTYQYTVCPMSAPYCCRSYDYIGERCCPGEMRVFQPAFTMGSVFGSLLVIGLFCALLYFCCFRQRRRNRCSSMHPRATVLASVDQDPPVLPVPVSKPTISDPPPPYPTAPLGPQPYAPPPYQPPTIGSVWDSPPIAPGNPGLSYPPPPPAPGAPNPNTGSGWNAPAPPYPPN